MHGVGGDVPPRRIWKGSVEHLLDADPVIAGIITRGKKKAPLVRVVPDPFEALVRAIMHQAVRAKRSSALVDALKAEFGGVFPEAPDILTGGLRKMRKIGLSKNQMNAIVELAKKVVHREIDFDALRGMDDDQIVAELQQLKGVGEWTAKMYLVFHLARPDVIMPDDVSLRNAVRKAYGLQAAPSPAELRTLAAKWAPWRSAAAWYVWNADGGLTPGLD